MTNEEKIRGALLQARIQINAGLLDSADRFIALALSALAAPAPQETPLPEILCGACGPVLDVRRVDGRYLATGYCPQCDHTPPASAPEGDRT